MGAERAWAAGRPGIGTDGWRSQAIPVHVSLLEQLPEFSGGGVRARSPRPTIRPLGPRGLQERRAGVDHRPRFPATGWISWQPAPVSDEAAEAREGCTGGNQPAAGPLVAPVDCRPAERASPQGRPLELSFGETATALQADP